MSLLNASTLDSEQINRKLEEYKIGSIKLPPSEDASVTHVQLCKKEVLLSYVLEVIKIQDILRLTTALGAKEKEHLIAFDRERFPLASLPLPLISSHILTSFRREAIANILKAENEKAADIRDAYFSKSCFLAFQKNSPTSRSSLQEDSEDSKEIFWEKYAVPAKMVEYTQHFIAALDSNEKDALLQKMYLLYKEIKDKQKDDILSFFRNGEVLQEVFNLYKNFVETEEGEQRDTLMREIQKTEVENGLIPFVDMNAAEDPIEVISQALEEEGAYKEWQEKNATACFERAIWDTEKKCPTSYGALVLLFVAKVTRFTNFLTKSDLYEISPEHQFIRAVSHESFEERLGSIEDGNLLKKLVRIYPMGFKAASAQLQADPKVCFEIAEILIKKTGIFSRYMPDDAIRNALRYIDLTNPNASLHNTFMLFFKKISRDQKAKDIFVQDMSEKLRECLLESKDLQLISEVRQWCETEEVAATYIDDQVIGTAIEATDWSHPRIATAITDFKEYFCSDDFARSKAVIKNLCERGEEISEETFQNIAKHLMAIGFTLEHVPEDCFEKVCKYFQQSTTHAIDRALQLNSSPAMLKKLIFQRFSEVVGRRVVNGKEIEALQPEMEKFSTKFFENAAFCETYTECMYLSSHPTFYFHLAAVEPLLACKKARRNLLYSFIKQSAVEDEKTKPLTKKKLVELLSVPLLAATFMELMENHWHYIDDYQFHCRLETKFLAWHDNVEDKFYKGMQNLLGALCSEELDDPSPLQKCIEFSLKKGFDYFAKNVEAIKPRAVPMLLEALKKENQSLSSETFKKIKALLEPQENHPAAEEWLSQQGDLNSVPMRFLSVSAFVPTFMKSIAQLDSARRITLFLEHAAHNPAWCVPEGLAQFRFKEIKMEDLKNVGLYNLDLFYIEGKDISLLELFSESILSEKELSTNFPNNTDTHSLQSKRRLLESLIAYEPRTERLKSVLKTIVSHDDTGFLLYGALYEIKHTKEKNPYQFFDRKYLEDKCLKYKDKCLGQLAYAIVTECISSDDYSSSFLLHEEVAVAVITESKDLHVNPFAILPDIIWERLLVTDGIKKDIPFLLKKNPEKVLQVVEVTNNETLRGLVFYEWLYCEDLKFEQMDQLHRIFEQFFQSEKVDQNPNLYFKSPSSLKIASLLQEFLPQSRALQLYCANNWENDGDQSSLISIIKRSINHVDLTQNDFPSTTIINALPMEGEPSSPIRVFFTKLFNKIIDTRLEILLEIDKERIEFFYAPGLYKQLLDETKDEESQEKVLLQWLSSPKFKDDCTWMNESFMKNFSKFDLFFTMWRDGKLEGINLDEILVFIFQSLCSESLPYIRGNFLIENKDMLDTIFQKVVPFLDAEQLRFLFVYCIDFEKIMFLDIHQQFSIFNSNILMNLQTMSHSGYKSSFEKKIESILEQFPAWLERMVREDRTILETVDGDFLKRIFEDPAFHRSAIREKLSNTLLELLQFDTSDDGKNIFKKWLEHYPDAMELALKDNPTWKEKVLQFLEANPLSDELQSRFLRLIDKSVTATQDMDLPWVDFRGYNASADTSYQAVRATVDTRNPGDSDAINEFSVNELRAEDIEPSDTTNPNQRHRETEKPKKSFLQRCKKWFVTLFQRLFAFLRSLGRSAN